MRFLYTLGNIICGVLFVLFFITIWISENIYGKGKIPVEIPLISIGIMLLSAVFPGMIYWVHRRCPKCREMLKRDFRKHCTNCGYEPQPDDEV